MFPSAGTGKWRPGNGAGNQGEECTFIDQRMLPDSPYLGCADTSPELRFNGCTESLVAVGMLALQMQSNVFEFFFGEWAA